MMAVSHVVIGSALWWGVAQATGQPAEPAALGLAALGSLLPDIDHPKSWAGRRMALVSIPLAALIGHRGVTHSLLAVAALALFLGLAGTGNLAAPLAVGYLSHLLADSMTLSGIPLAWPSKQAYGLRLLRTGSLAEIALIGALGAGLAAAGAETGDLARAGKAFKEVLKVVESR
ncbi:Predicted membrane-bound metal-dependent hydrolase [Rhodospirillaceae bacterium LM-1]|nr:Predicted membrane-bound metal-dependent hydrolase [Rhodospirillaceae bacterium LM-1]